MSYLHRWRRAEVFTAGMVRNQEEVLPEVRLPLLAEAHRRKGPSLGAQPVMEEEEIKNIIKLRWGEELMDGHGQETLTGNGGRTPTVGGVLVGEILPLNWLQPRNSRRGTQPYMFRPQAVLLPQSKTQDKLHQVNLNRRNQMLLKRRLMMTILLPRCLLKRRKER